MEPPQGFLVEGLVMLAKIGQRQIREPPTRLQSITNDGAHHVVPLAERDSPLHEEVDQFRGQRAGVDGGLHALHLHCHRVPGGGEHVEAVVDCGESVEDRFLVLLQVLPVGQAQALHRREQREQIAIDAPRLAAHQFERVGVLLLRHHARPGRVGIIEFDESELRRRPEDEILAVAAQMCHQDRQGRQGFEEKITVAHRIDAVRRHAREAQFVRHELAVQFEGGPGQRPGAQGHAIGPPSRVIEPAGIALQRPEQGQGVVGEQDGLRLLQMCVPRHDGVEVLTGTVYQNLL